jgi:DNA-binding Lrp family transcriptional regulator
MLQNSVAMVETAYLLIALDRNTPAAVARDVLNVPGVVKASVTMGDYDVIAIAEQEDTKGFPGITAAVRRIEGVRAVVTCVVVTP